MTCDSALTGCSDPCTRPDLSATQQPGTKKGMQGSIAPQIAGSIPEVICEELPYGFVWV